MALGPTRTMDDFVPFELDTSPRKGLRKSIEAIGSCWRADWYDPRWCIKDPKPGTTFFAAFYGIVDGFLMLLYAKWAKDSSNEDAEDVDLLLNQAATALACFYGVWCIMDIFLFAVIFSQKTVTGLNMWLFATSARYLHLAVDPTLLVYTCVYHEGCAGTAVPSILSFLFTLPLPWAQLVVMKFERSEEERSTKEHRIGRLSEPPSWVFPLTDTYGVPPEMKLNRQGKETKTPDLSGDSFKTPRNLTKIHEELNELSVPDIEAGPSRTSLGRSRTLSRLTIEPSPVPLHGDARRKERGGSVEERGDPSSVGAVDHPYPRMQPLHQDLPVSRAASRASHATHASYATTYAATHDSRTTVGERSSPPSHSQRMSHSGRRGSTGDERSLQLTDFPGYRSRGGPSTASGRGERSSPKKSSRIPDMKEVVIGPPAGRVKSRGKAKTEDEERKSKTHSKKKHRTHV